MSAEIHTGPRIHPQPDAQPEPLPAATVTGLASVLPQILAAHVKQDPPVARTRCERSSPESNDGALGEGSREQVAADAPATPSPAGEACAEEHGWG